MGPDVMLKASKLISIAADVVVAPAVVCQVAAVPVAAAVAGHVVFVIFDALPAAVVAFDAVGERRVRCVESF